LTECLFPQVMKYFHLSRPIREGVVSISSVAWRIKVASVPYIIQRKAQLRVESDVTSPDFAFGFMPSMCNVGYYSLVVFLY
jgi:hypothetical protein